MKIQVKGYLALGERFALPPVVELPEESTLHVLLEALSGEILQAVEARNTDPLSVRKRGAFAVLLNGIHYSHLSGGLETRLKDQDEVAIFPPIAGGRGT